MTVNDVVGRDEEVATPEEPLEWRADDGRWTLGPVDAAGDGRSTRWIAVESGGLYDLEEWR